MTLRVVSCLVKGLACLTLVMFVFDVLFRWHGQKEEMTAVIQKSEQLVTQQWAEQVTQQHTQQVTQKGAEQVTQKDVDETQQGKKNMTQKGVKNMTQKGVKKMTQKVVEGYIVVQNFGDQLSAGVKNIMSLQCLASKIGGVAVIEPWIIKSYYGVDMSVSQQRHDTLKFRDLHDLMKWNQYTTSLHYSPLVPVENFNETVQSSNLQNLILVEYNCKNGSNVVLKNGLTFCKMFGLKLVKHVCFNFSKAVDFISFKKQLYSCYKPNEVVVFFSFYRGIRPENHKLKHKTHPLYVSGTECEIGRNEFVFSGLYPSSSIMCDAEDYINKYMNGNHNYIAVMVRIEKSLQHTNHFKKWKAESGATICVQNVIAQWKKAQEYYGIYHTFLTTDVGLFGSDTLKGRGISSVLNKAVEYLFSVVHNGTLSLSQWEHSFTTIGKGQIKSPAYIAMIQKVVSAKGTVLMTAGGYSTFHASTQMLHQQLHHIPQVITLGEDCS